MAEEHRPDAEDALGVLLVVHGETVRARDSEVGEQRVDIGDRVRGARTMPVAAQIARTSASVIVASIALPAAEACGTSRWPSGVWNRTLPGPSTRSMKTG